MPLRTTKLFFFAPHKCLQLLEQMKEGTWKVASNSMTTARDDENMRFAVERIVALEMKAAEIYNIHKHNICYTSRSL